MSENTSQPSPTSESPWGENDDLTADLDLGFDGAEDLLRTWRQGMRPDPDLTVSEWADQHRWLSSRASAEPGRYRTARTPYLREIMDALSPRHPAQRISLMKAAQVGATEAGNNWIGFVIHHAPGPMLAVLPTVEMAKRTSRGRLRLSSTRAAISSASTAARPPRWAAVGPETAPGSPKTINFHRNGRPMTDLNERGITINKALAWTMLVSVTGLIWWGGGTLASLQGAADRLTLALTETREMIVAERASSAQLEARVRALETSAARQDSRFDALPASINELKEQARETNTLLRELAKRP